jgi:hypothetical protein
VAENAVERAKPESEVYESVTKAAPPEPDADQVAPVEKPKSDALDLSAQNNQEQSKLQEQTRLQNPLTTEAQPGIEAQPQTEPRPSVADNGELPRTAGETPLIALIGILCVAGGLALRVLPGANRERSEPQLNS